jgi:TusE/DsrC/DsvC family sulfur relay protein
MNILKHGFSQKETKEGGMTMPVLNCKEIENRRMAVDEEGYLVNYNDWTESVANALAAREGLGELTREQIAMLQFIRGYYNKYNFFPIIRTVCKNVHLPRNCVYEEFFSPLLAWKLAGLPQPEEPMRSFLEAGQTPT